MTTEPAHMVSRLGPDDALNAAVIDLLEDLGEHFGAKLIGVDVPVPQGEEDMRDEIELWFSKDLSLITGGVGTRSYRDAVDVLVAIATQAHQARQAGH